jgi:hypothetical protein
MAVGTSALSPNILIQMSQSCFLFFANAMQRNGCGPPHRAPFPLGAQPWERCALFLKVPHMKNKAPAAGLPTQPDGDPDELKPPELLVTRSKATFQWPPDCLWRFIDHKANSDA